MEKEDRETMRHMSETLDKMLVVLSKSPNKGARIFEIIATGITILGVISAIDIIKNWIGG